MSISGQAATDAVLADMVRRKATIPTAVVIHIENPEALPYPRLHTVLAACWDAGVMAVEINGVPVRLFCRPGVDRAYERPFPSFEIVKAEHVEMFRLIDHFNHPTASLVCGPKASIPRLLETLQVAHERGLPVGLTLGFASRELGILLLAPELVWSDPTIEARKVLIKDISGPGAETARRVGVGLGCKTFVMGTTRTGFEESTPGFVRIANTDMYKKHVGEFFKETPPLDASVLAPGLARAFEELDKEIAKQTPWQTRFRTPHTYIIVETGGGFVDWKAVRELLTMQPYRKNVNINIIYRAPCPRAIYDEREEVVRLALKAGIVFSIECWGSPPVAE